MNGGSTPKTGDLGRWDTDNVKDRVWIMVDNCPVMNKKHWCDHNQNLSISIESNDIYKHEWINWDFHRMYPINRLCESFESFVRKLVT